MAAIYPSDGKNAPSDAEELLEDLAALRRKYHAEKEVDAMRQLACQLQDGKGELELLVRIIISGTTQARADRISTLQNIGLTSALLGAISVTILLCSPTRADALVSSNHLLSEATEKIITQMFYALWAVASMCEIAAVALVTIGLMHLDLMINASDDAWFLPKWHFPIFMLPQIFMVTGCFTTIFGCMMGAFLVGDTTSGYFTFLLGVFLTSIVLPIWLFMLNRNKARELATSKEIKEYFLSSNLGRNLAS